MQPGEPFVLQLSDGQSLTSSQMQLTTPLSLTRIAKQRGSPRHAGTLAGSQLCADFALPSDAGSATGASSRATAQTISARNSQSTPLRPASPLPKSSSSVSTLPDATTVGTVAGSPIVNANFFLGYEDPLATNTVGDGNIECALQRTLPLEPNQAITYSAVIGWSASRPDAARLARYIEQERAHPYRTFLHYNSWYDIGYGERYDQAAAIDRIHAFGDELVRKRHVGLESFLFDDGWDNTSSLWKMDSGFPDGFTPVRKAAHKYGFGIGVWLSPWGGYSTERRNASPSERRQATKL